MRAHEFVNENFADGKVKGKSRPGRVKRAGASCDGSVTDLRARAKNASGEKAKMYHWCANMKSGRKKMKQYATNVTGSQYNLNESIAPGFQVYQARVKVKNPDYSTSIDVAVFAKSPAMAKLLLQGQYGKDSVVSGVVKIS